MTFPDLPPGPWQDQDADLAAELDSVKPERDEPSDEELAGLWPDAGRPTGCEDWVADEFVDRNGGWESLPGPGAGFGDGRTLDALGPGPALAGFAKAVLDDGLNTLSDDELIGLLRASRRLSAWQDGVELAAVAQLDARRVYGSVRPGSLLVDEQVSAELAAALVLTGRSADALLGLARDIGRLPAVRRALLEGLIDRARARVFAEELAGLGDVAAAAAAAALANPAASMTTSKLRAELRALVLWLDPAAARKRAENARDWARVETWQESSGNVGIVGRELPAGDALAADKRLTAIAKALKKAGAVGTLDQLRAAVFLALLGGRDPDTLLPPAPEQHGADNPGRSGDPVGSGPGSSGTAGRRGYGAGEPGGSGTGKPGNSGQGGLGALTGTVHLVMPAAAWLGLSDAPGDAAGLGPLDAWTCRDLADRLAAGIRTRWQVTLTGPDGRAVAHTAARAGPGPPSAAPGEAPGGPDGRAWLTRLTFDWLERGTCSHPRQVLRYQPDNRLRNLICARRRTCSFPGCRRPAVACDADHTVPYDQGGRTCECNLSPLCRKHHHVKQADGWTLTQPEPGVLIWNAPHGRSYTVIPDAYLT